jgi:mRNA interferase HigB
MLVGNYEALQKFARKHARSRSSLDAWYQVTTLARWRNFDDVKKTFGATDIYHDCVIFDIAGNRYRLIAIIRYDLEQVDIEAILTHAEYARDKWKKNC